MIMESKFERDLFDVAIKCQWQDKEVTLFTQFLLIPESHRV